MIGDFSIGIKETFDEICDCAVEDASVFIDFCHEEGLCKRCLNLADDCAFNVVGFMEVYDF